MVAPPLLKIGGAANVLGCFWAGLAGKHLDHVWHLTVHWLPDLVWPLFIDSLYMYSVLSVQMLVDLAYSTLAWC
jgi:hypothetical protein